MLSAIHRNRSLQLVLGLAFGICFGVLLQRGGLTDYNVLMGQLRLYDWTVAKVILSAVLIGMLGVHALYAMGLAKLSASSGSVGGTVLGGLIFGAGFALLGYCPGTLAGAVGAGSMHGLLGGVPGMILGSVLYAHMHPGLKGIRGIGSFKNQTLPELLNMERRRTVLLMVAVLALLLLALYFVDPPVAGPM